MSDYDHRMRLQAELEEAEEMGWDTSKIRREISEFDASCHCAKEPGPHPRHVGTVPRIIGQIAL